MPNIESVTITPSIVFCGNALLISVSVTDPLTWLLDSEENFLTDSNGSFLLEGGD